MAPFTVIVVLLFVQFALPVPGGLPWIAFVFPFFAFFINYFLMRNVLDEVRDCGDYLTVSRNGREDQILLSDISNININLWTNPKRINLKLRTTSIFGDSLVFIPRSNRFALRYFFRPGSDIAEDLIERVERLRSARSYQQSNS